MRVKENEGKRKLEGYENRKERERETERKGKKENNLAKKVTLHTVYREERGGGIRKRNGKETGKQ